MKRTANMGVARTFGFRWLLPLLLTSVHVGLILVSAHAGRPQAVTPAEVRYRTVAFQEDGTVDFHPVEPRPLSLPEKVVLLLNLPALLIAIPIAAYVFHGTELGLVCSATPFVPVLWYCVGRWLDVRLGFLPVRPTPSPGAKIVRLAAVATGLAFILMGVFGLTRTNHVRTADAILMGTALLLWGALFLGLRPPRRLSECRL